MAHVEKSPNSHYKCRQCRKKIRKLQYCVGVVIPNKEVGQYPKTRWYHSKCYPRAAGKNGVPRPELRRDFSGYSQLPLNEQRRLRKSLWPNQVSDKMKPRLQIRKKGKPVPLSDIKRAQLEFECEQRDLPKSEIKNVMRQSLKEYLESNECDGINDVLVHGFCRQQTDGYRLNLPIYLRDIVRSYYPTLIG